eukprot:4906954-Lingulodinium_polyedra.AAC.1
MRVALSTPCGERLLEQSTKVEFAFAIPFAYAARVSVYCSVLSRASSPRRRARCSRRRSDVARRVGPCCSQRSPCRGPTPLNVRVA